MSKSPRILVLGYSDIGFCALQYLLDQNKRVVSVFTHPDNPNEKIWFRSMEQLARQHNIPVYKPLSIKSSHWISVVQEWKPDLIFSFYYRNLIPLEILKIPSLGAFNLHGSLLPKYRGCCPVNWAIINGETQTGATLHHMTTKVDAGDIVDQEPVTIGTEESVATVMGKVKEAALSILKRQLDNLLSGNAPRLPQREEDATCYGKRRPENGRINWFQSAQDIFNLIRAVTHPYPGAFSEHRGNPLFLWWGHPIEKKTSASPGEVIALDPLTIATGKGLLEVNHFHWKNPLSVPLHVGDIFT